MSYPPQGGYDRSHDRNQPHDERRAYSARGTARDRSRSPVRGQRWESNDPYAPGRGGGSAQYADQRWDHSAPQDPYGYAQQYAYTAAYPSAEAVGLPYDTSYAEYQEPRAKETYTAGGKGQTNPPSRDVIFLGLEPTYTEQAVRPFSLSLIISHPSTADARVPSDAMCSTSRQDDHRTGSRVGRITRIRVCVILESNRGGPLYPNTVGRAVLP